MNTKQPRAEIDDRASVLDSTEIRQGSAASYHLPVTPDLNTRATAGCTLLRDKRSFYY